MPSPVTCHDSLPIAQGSIRIVVVSDSHARPHPRTAELISLQQPHAILHAGDVGALSVIDELRTIAPTLAVRGNIDTPCKELPDARVIDLVDVQRPVLRLLLVHYALNGPRLRNEAVMLARAQKAGLIVCGHSHVPFIGHDKGLAVFNPGSVGPRRFRLPIVFGVIELAQGSISLEHVDCETGEQWKP